MHFNPWQSSMALTSVVLCLQVDDLESLEVREEANVDGVMVRGNHFLHVSREMPFRIYANDRTIFTGRSRSPTPAAAPCTHTFFNICCTE